MASISLSFRHVIDIECIFIVLYFYENQRSDMAVTRNRICVKNALFCRLISLDEINPFSICKRCLNCLLVCFDMLCFCIFISFFDRLIRQNPFARRYFEKNPKMYFLDKAIALSPVACRLRDRLDLITVWT